MSSFCIAKQEYVKAAGLIYGAESTKADAHKYFMDNVREMFEEVYMMNEESVAEQYGEDLRPDEQPYDEVFDKYVSIGQRVWRGQRSDITREKLVHYLMKFFQSALYQIEDEFMATQAAGRFFRCIAHLISIDNIDGWWGEVEI